MATILGIDIGKRSVRGAMIRTSLRNFEIDRYLEVPISSLEPGAARAPLVSSALRELIGALGGTPDSVIVALDGMRVSLRHVQLPPGAKKRIAEVLPFELEALLPFPVDEAVIDYQEVGTRDAELNLLAAAVPHGVIEETLALLETAQISPRELAVGAASLDGLLALLQQPADETWLLLHVDAEQSDVCIVNGGRSELCRTFDEGASSLAAGSRAVQMALHQTVMKYRAEGGPLIGKLLVMGDAAVEPAWVQSLGEAINAPAQPVTLPGTHGSQEAPSPIFGKALALAARVLRRGKRLDLRKGKFAPVRGVSQLRNYALLAAVCSLGLVISYTFSIWARYRVLAEERDALSEKLEQVTDQHFGEKTRSVTRARELLEGGGKSKDPLPRFDAYRVLGAISAAVPESVTHDTRKLEIILDEGGQTGKFTLQGQIPDLAARDLVAEALEAHECIEQIERGKTSTVPGQDRKTYTLEGVIACPGAAKKTKGGDKARAK
jgi:type II secretory pathway component PulL